MPLINATWKVTHAGVVLLDWTDFSDGEPHIDRSFLFDGFAALSGSGSGKRYLTRENLSHTVAFTRVVYFQNDDEARTFEREHTASLSVGSADCLIEWLNTGLSDTLEDAVISSYRAHVENNMFMADYALQGGKILTSGFTPPPPPTETGTWRLITVDGPPGGVTLQVKNSSDVWEDVWTYTASS